LLGFYNPSITQRLNGLVERQDLTTKDKEIISEKPSIVINYTPPIEEE